jgi:hypothetical protein
MRGVAGNEGAGRGEVRRCAAAAMEIKAEATTNVTQNLFMTHTRYASAYGTELNEN